VEALPRVAFCERQTLRLDRGYDNNGVVRRLVADSGIDDLVCCDPANARDRRTLQEDGTDSDYESAKASARALRASAASAADSRPHGRVPYGYRRRYDPATGRLAAQEVEPVEAAVVR
jgi:hypothetical protein